MAILSRALQLVNVAFDGTSISILTTIGRVYLWNFTLFKLEKGSIVEELFGRVSQINFVHRQSIKDLAPNFRATVFYHGDKILKRLSR